MAAAGILTLAGGGTPLQAVEAMAFAYVSMAVWTNVGAFLRTEGVAGNLLVKGLVHGVVGGTLSVAQGGHFIQGFAANAIGADVGLMSNAVSGGNVLLDTAIVGAAGGAASVLTGGKFDAGFITAAFANLFNKFQLLSGAQLSGECSPYGSVSRYGERGSIFYEGPEPGFSGIYEAAVGPLDVLAGGIVGGIRSLGASLAEEAAAADTTATSILGQSFGKLGTVVEDPGLSITSMSGHAVDQAITRGVSPQAILGAVQDPLVVLQQSNGTFLFWFIADFSG